MDYPIIETVAGKIRGAIERQVYTFKGVHYGESTNEKHRFLPPVPVKSWVGIRDAYHFGPISPQFGALVDCVEEASDEKVTGIRWHLPQSEDCLVLNLWTPALNDDGKRPVMVWLHGRGFAEGAGSEISYNGADLARTGDVVVITVNHRLNVMGYLHLADIAGKEFEGSGVAGMLDAVLALRWVHDNIEKFGGDAGNVTIFGESGGGVKVSTLLGMPSAKGLFHRAIIQSGPGIAGVDAKYANEITEHLLAKLNINKNEITKLQELPFQQILNAAREVGNDMAASRPAGRLTGARVGGVMDFRPVVEGKYLPAHPFLPVTAPTVADVPILIGTNRHESALFLATLPQRGVLTEDGLRKRLVPVLGAQCDNVIKAYRKNRPDATPWDLLIAINSEGMRRGSITLAERKSEKGKAPVYMYLFTYESGYLNGIFKSCHFMEIGFMFNHVDDVPLCGGRPDKYGLAEQMSKAWIAFARTGNPNHPGLPKWSPYTTKNRATMLFDVPSKVIEDPFREELDAWEGIPLSRM
jgi:para-nitrobenzyl esterase